jgi:aminodeoxyfutalosine synthase
VKATLPKYLQAGKSADTALQSIAAKVHASERITTDDALLLYERASLSFAGSLANLIRERKHGDRTYFNRNFHIEPTNVCVYDC